jgi:hypothetical protein
MEKFNRAERRAQRERLKNKRKSYWGHGDPRWIDGEMNPKELGIAVNTTQRCSRPACCGNPRRGKWKGLCFGRTLAEVVQEITLEEQKREVEENDEGNS